MKKSIFYFLIFLCLNFLALGLGIYLMDGGPLSEWYLDLNKAPWTPPNQAFGICWSIIMICFALYLTYLIKSKQSHLYIWSLYILQWILNSGWNYVFFNQQNILMGLWVILLLFLVITYFLFYYLNLLKWKTIWILPYFIWLMVAISLNSYIFVYNP